MDAVAEIRIPEEINGETGPVLNAQLGAAVEAYDALSGEELAREDVQEAASVMMQVMDALTGGVEPLALISGEQFTVNVVKVVNGVAVETKNITAKCLQTTGHSGYNHSTNLRSLANMSGFTGYIGYNWSRYTTVPSTYTRGLAPNNNYASVHYNIVGSAPYKADETLFLFFEEKSYSYSIRYDTQGGTAIDPTSVTSTDTSVTLSVTNQKPAKAGYTFKGWATTPGAAIPNAASSYRLTSDNPTMTLYAVWEAERVTLSSEKITKVFRGITREQVPADFSIRYTISSAINGGGTVYASGTLTSPISRDIDGNPAYEYSVPSFSVPRTTGPGGSINSSWYVTISESNADVDGYTYSLAARSHQSTYSSLGGNDFFYNDYTENKLDYTITWHYTKESHTAQSQTKGSASPGERVPVGGISVPEEMEYESENYTYKRMLLNGSEIQRPEGSYQFLLESGKANTLDIYYELKRELVTVKWMDGYSAEPIKTIMQEKGAEVPGEAYPDDPTRPGYTFDGWDDPVTDGDGNITITAKWTRNKPDWTKLTLEKEADVTAAKPGETVTYTLKVTNNTDRDLTGVQVSEKLDGNLTLISADGDGSYEGDVWTVGSLANGASATLTIQASVNEGIADGTVIKNTAIVTDAAGGGENLPTGEQPEGEAQITVDNPTVPVTPVTPKVAAYRVEHYQQREDDSYALVETEFPLYGEIGAAVTATVRQYDHYHVNRDQSLLSGEVVMPKLSGDQVELLVLKVYYDIDTVTVRYDLNGAVGAGYEQESVKYGASVTVKEPPEREGYMFIGWSDGKNIYQAGDSIRMSEDITLTAQWKENAKPTDPKPTDPKPTEPDAPKTGDETNMGLMLCVMGVSLAGIVLLAFLLLKKNYSGKYLK